MTILNKYVCWRCGAETTEIYMDHCPECGENTVVRVADLVDFANEMYLSNVVNNRLQIQENIARFNIEDMWEAMEDDDENSSTGY